MTPASSASKADKEAAAKVRAYMASLPPGVRRTLKQLREVIREVAPGVTDGFSYGIPAYRLDGRTFLWYAGWKNHVSLYPITDAIRRKHAAALKGLETAKGTVRFPLSEPLPLPLIERLVKARLTELRTRGH